jgi:hypothetical protein
MHEITRAASTTYDDLWEWNTLEWRLISYTLGFSHKSPSVGEDASPHVPFTLMTILVKKMMIPFTLMTILVKNDDVSSALLKKEKIYISKREKNMSEKKKKKEYKKE